MSKSTKTSKATQEYTTKTIRCGTVIVTIHRPILTPAEREKRERQVVNALTQYSRSLSH